MWWWLACAPNPIPWCREDPAYDAMIAQLDLAMASGAVPGASVAIVEDGSLVCSEAVGSRRFSADEPVGRDTRFGFGSLTKMLTSAAVLRAGIDLDEPVTALVPDLAVAPSGDARLDDPSAITVGQLLAHTAGYRDEVGVGIDTTCAQFADVEAFVAHPRRLVTPPGLAHHYANPGYAVVDVALQSATELEYAQAMDRLVFEPFGMARVSMDVVDIEADGDFAFGYYDPATTDVGATGEIAPSGWSCPGWVAAAGGFGTAEDLGRFAEGIFDPDGPFDADQRAALLGPQVSTGLGDGYGLGMNVLSYGDATLYGHTGRYAGFLTALVLEPATGTAVAALFDSDELGPGAFALDITATLAGLGPPEDDPASPDPAMWADFTGAWTYTGDWHTPDATDVHAITVRQDRDHLFFSRDGGEEEELLWVWGDGFYLPSEDDTYVFVREGGVATWMVGRGWSAKRPQ